VPAQPVDATPSAINLFAKGGFYDAGETGLLHQQLGFVVG
jgi:hypothetical protein